MNEAGAESPQPLRQRAKVAMGVLGLVVLADLNAILADLDLISLVDDVIAGERISLAEVNDSDDRFATAGTIQIVATLIAAITFLLWFSRAYRNSVRMGTQPRRSHRWAIGGWFVPIISLVRPKQIADDIWRGSDPDDPAPAVEGAGAKRVNPLLHLWWAAWIIGGFVGNFAIRSAFREPATPEAFKSEAQAYLVTDLIDIVAIGLAVLVIREITNRQEARRARFETGALMTGAAVAVPASAPASPVPQPAAVPEPEPAAQPQSQPAQPTAPPAEPGVSIPPPSAPPPGSGL